MSKKYVYVVMTNMDPMGRAPEWEPERAFFSRKEAHAFLKKEWRENWLGYATTDIPLQLDDMFYIEKVVLG